MIRLNDGVWKKISDTHSEERFLYLRVYMPLATENPRQAIFDKIRIYMALGSSSVSGMNY